MDADHDETVHHWHGSFTDPTNGVTYDYNMVGNEDLRDAKAGTTTVARRHHRGAYFTFAANAGLTR